MPLRQTIGISLALLMASSGAFANPTEKSSAYHPAPVPNAEPGKSPNRSGKSRLSQKKTHSRTGRSAARLWHRHAWTFHAAIADDGGPDPQWGPMHAAGAPQIGQAAWYDLVGRRTSSGEPLDAVTLTAAHRSLPLGSCAKVTNLDTGYSVIVRINDRGPYSRRFIIDLSPRAARDLGMIHSGTAAVAVEPLAADGQIGPAEMVVYRGPAAETMQ